MNYSILKHLNHIVVSADSFFGVLFGGINYDNTISSTIGYYKKTSDSKYWELLRLVVDLTFWFIEGKGHCEKAYKSDPNEDFYVMSKTGLLFITVLGCIILSIIFIVIWGLKKIISFININ